MSLRTDTILELKKRLQETVTLLRLTEEREALSKLETQMQSPDFWREPEKAAQISKRHEEIRENLASWDELQKNVDDLLEMSESVDGEANEALGEDIVKQTAVLSETFAKKELQVFLDAPHDKNNAIVSFHAGSGGTEAQDWAAMLRRMIMRFAEKRGWAVTLLDESRGEPAGIKSSVIRIEGRYAYGYLQSEHGTHRLVRISPFDAEKMRHTSFAGIDVLPEIDESAAIEINPNDLRIDTFMAGGKGGQSVNTTYSAVRIVHIPTGLTVQCQNERSQLQNKETALRVLQAKLVRLKEEAEAKERQSLRGEYKSAEWGNQIRSYVLQPYKLVKDVRTKYESTDPEAVLEGELEPFMEAYLRYKKSSL